MNQPSEPQPLTLADVIRTGWKKLALADQTDADEVVKTLREVLEDLERLEAAAESEAAGK